MTLMEAAWRSCSVPKRVKLHSALILAQIAFAGFEILSRVAMLKGAGQIVFSFYRNCIATLLLGILGFILEKKRRPALTFSTACKFFFLGFLGVTLNQVCYLAGLKYTSAIFASAMRNITPVITFILAVVCRMEKLRLRRLDGQAKVVGSTLAICGSVLLSMYKGPAVIKNKLSHDVSADRVQPQDLKSFSAEHTIRIFWLFSVHIKSWQLGSIFIVVSCLAFAAFLILQAPVLKKYPAPISFAAFCCLSAVLQLPLLALIFEPQRSKWRPAHISEVTSIIYAGVVASGLVSGIQAWGVYEGGPVLVAAYQPLETVVTAILSFLVLFESLHLGSITGGFLVISGLYLLIWAQERERRERYLTSAKVSDDHHLSLTHQLQSSFAPLISAVEGSSIPVLSHTLNDSITMILQDIKVEKAAQVLDDLQGTAQKTSEQKEKNNSKSDPDVSAGATG